MKRVKILDLDPGAPRSRTEPSLAPALSSDPRLQALIDDPTPETWRDAHCLIIDRHRLWQAVTEVDPTHPREWPVIDPEGELVPSKVPDRETILKAILLITPTEGGAVTREELLRRMGEAMESLTLNDWLKIAKLMKRPLGPTTYRFIPDWRNGDARPDTGNTRRIQ